MAERERFDAFTLPPDEGALDDAPAPTQLELDSYSRNRVRRFIIQSALFGGATGEMVAGLYADLAGDDRAGRYLDARFLLRQMPPDWRQVEDTVLDLAEDARRRGVDLAAAWRRAGEVATEQPDEDPLDALARLAGIEVGRRPVRSIFDDPDDLDEEADALGADAPDPRAPLPPDRPPSLHDLSPTAQEAIQRFVIEERLERGLAPVALMELYRALALDGDERARQYLDRVYVEGDLPPEWRELQVEAEQVFELAARRGKEAGVLYAALHRRGGGLSALDLLHRLRDELT